MSRFSNRSLLSLVPALLWVGLTGVLSAEDPAGVRSGPVLGRDPGFPLLPGSVRELSAASSPDRDSALLPGWMRGDFRRPSFPVLRQDLMSDGGEQLLRPVIPDLQKSFPVEPPVERPEFDEFVPAPVPAGLEDPEAEEIREALTRRYSSPPMVRAIRSLSLQSAMNLHAEVSERIDNRSLEPTSYATRVRRALRNLLLAVGNEAFRNAMGLADAGFELDTFRQRLGDRADRLRVVGFSDARRVLSEVVNDSRSVRGLPAAVVAWEFAVAGVDTLDRFSGLTPEDPGSRRSGELTEVRTAALEKDMVGVGIEVVGDPLGLRLVRALRGSPAAAAGLRRGDLVLEVNGRSLAGLSVAVASDLMQGTEGQSLRLKVRRDGAGVGNFTLVRARFRLWTVNDAELLRDTSVGYVSLSRFAGTSAAELSSTMEGLYRRGMRSMILDLRGNPGGLLTTCVEISNLFLPRGTIVSTRGRLASDNQHETASFARTWKLPLVVLIDENSASASEILAAAVQENGRGVVVGTRSYGKGSVQTHFPLESISGNLRLTTALFFSPNGRRMAGAGVTPDVEVVDADGAVGGDRVLETALELAGSSQARELARTAVYRRGNPSHDFRGTQDANRALPVGVSVL